ncbi:MAG: transposase [Chloroflexota bacterium]
MIELETFLTILYAMADDFCKSKTIKKRQAGRQASLSPSEVVTLAIAGQWFWFGSERGFYRYLTTHFKTAFPSLPHRSQLNRLIRKETEIIVSFAHFLAEQMGAAKAAYEAIDASAVPTRDINRRGNGWLPGLADYGKSNRLGYYEGFHLLLSVTPIGVITGFGFGSASTKDTTLVETFFAARAQPQPRLTSVGLPAAGEYLADKGFSLPLKKREWLALYNAHVISAPKHNNKTIKWPKKLRLWLASLRQIVETVFEKLHNTFRLARERPHDLTGFQARLASKVALHNFCIWLNLRLERQPLAFAQLIQV